MREKGPKWTERHDKLCLEETTGELAAGFMRYELLRTLNVSEFSEIWKQNLHGEKFDDLVDLWIEERLKKEELKQTLKCQCFSIEDEPPRYAEHVCGLPATHQAKNHVLMCDRHAEEYRSAYPFRIKPIEIGKGEK